MNQEHGIQMTLEKEIIQQRRSVVVDHHFIELLCFHIHCLKDLVTEPHMSCDIYKCSKLYNPSQQSNRMFHQQQTVYFYFFCFIG